MKVRSFLGAVLGCASLGYAEDFCFIQNESNSSLGTVANWASSSWNGSPRGRLPSTTDTIWICSGLTVERFPANAPWTVSAGVDILGWDLFVNDNKDELGTEGATCYGRIDGGTLGVLHDVVIGRGRAMGDVTIASGVISGKYFTVRSAGLGSTLRQTGGYVYAPDTFRLGGCGRDADHTDDPDYRGSVYTITGPSSLMEAYFFTIGHRDGDETPAAQHSTLIATGGATVRSTGSNFDIGWQRNAEMIVSGEGTSLSSYPDGGDFRIGGTDWYRLNGVTTYGMWTGLVTVANHAVVTGRNVQVGCRGYGRLVITNGAYFRAPTEFSVALDVERNPANPPFFSEGYVLVDNATLEVGRKYSLGNRGYGEMILTNGAFADICYAKNDHFYVGNEVGSTGRLEVCNSTLFVTNRSLVVGQNGRGLVTVKDGSSLKLFNLRIGSDKGSTGSVFHVTGKSVINLYTNELSIFGGVRDFHVIIDDHSTFTNMNSLLIAQGTQNRTNYSANSRLIVRDGSTFFNRSQIEQGNVGDPGATNIGVIVDNAFFQVGTDDNYATWYLGHRNGEHWLNLTNNAAAWICQLDLGADNTYTTGRVFVTTGSVMTNKTLKIGRHGWGEVTVGEGSSVVASHEIKIPAESSGRGTLNMHGGDVDCLYLTADDSGATGSAFGRIEGYGDIRFSELKIWADWAVVANGFGVDRTLDLSQRGCLTQDNVMETAYSNGWWAVNHGCLLLPNPREDDRINNRGGRFTIGDRLYDHDWNFPRVNCVTGVLNGAVATTGNAWAKGAIYAADHGDVPPGLKDYSNADIRCVWRLSLDSNQIGENNWRSDFERASLTFFYDTSLPDAHNDVSGKVYLYRYDGTSWNRIAKDFMANGIPLTVTGLAPNTGVSAQDALGWFAVKVITGESGSCLILK